MNPKPVKESVKLWQPGIEGLELMRATYVTQRFPRHSHDGFAVGVIEDGALGFYYRGANVVASPGAINLANPDEPHTGHAADASGWTYRMYYMSPDLLQQVADLISDRPVGFPFFQEGVLHDPQLAGSLRGLHADWEEKRVGRLEAQSRFMEMLVRLIRRHADAPPRSRPVGCENGAVERAREYLEDCYGEDLSIQELAAVAGLSPYHFIRVFGRQTGLPPHTYLTQIRVRRVRAMLRDGLSVAEAAYAAGFSDQSHLTRHFKRLTGITPGKYRRIVQEKA
ncbi:MAG: AraC family transcriptional regulator [Desulfobacterales bacterium]|nr:AraC family transcriptional regulator [Desulfobacterales bacterium]